MEKFIILDKNGVIAEGNEEHIDVEWLKILADYSYFP